MPLEFFLQVESDTDKQEEAKELLRKVCQNVSHNYYFCLFYIVYKCKGPTISHTVEKFNYRFIGTS
jgi:hypothetical protein